jgi:hypothetical protein
MKIQWYSALKQNKIDFRLVDDGLRAAAGSEPRQKGRGR